MFIGFLAAAALAVPEPEEGVLLLLLQAASASAPATPTATKRLARPMRWRSLLRRRDRVAGIDSTARLLHAHSLGGGLAVRPAGRVPARPAGFHLSQLSKGIHGQLDPRMLPSQEPPLCDKHAAPNGVHVQRTTVRNTVTR